MSEVLRSKEEIESRTAIIESLVGFSQSIVSRPPEWLKDAFGRRVPIDPAESEETTLPAFEIVYPYPTMRVEDWEVIDVYGPYPIRSGIHT